MAKATTITTNSDGTATLYQSGAKIWRGPLTDLPAFLGASAPAPRKPKKEKPKSRAQRWSDAASAAISALEELRSIQEDELEPWKDGLPENLQQSTLGEKLDTICGIDIESALEAAQEAEGADMPLGFGRD